MLKRPRLPTRREPRQARALATREHILTAAARALREEGPDVSVTRIAERAGYGIGTVYEYFPNRRSLLCELMHQTCEDEFAAILALAPELEHASVPELVTRVLALLVESAATNRVLMRIVLTEVLPTLEPAELEDLRPLFVEVLAAHLRERASDACVQDPELSARVILVGVEAIIEDAVLHHPQSLERPAFLTELTALVGGYLSTPRASVEEAAPRSSVG